MWKCVNGTRVKWIYLLSTLPEKIWIEDYSMKELFLCVAIYECNQIKDNEARHIYKWKSTSNKDKRINIPRMCFIRYGIHSWYKSPLFFDKRLVE